MTGWVALRIQLPVDREDDILLTLHEAGTVGVRVVGDEAPEPPADGRAGGPSIDPGRTAVVYFGAGTDLQPLIAKLAVIGEGLVLGTGEVEEEPWVERQERSRKPLRIGRSFLILPWVREREEGDAAGRFAAAPAVPAFARTKGGRTDAASSACAPNEARAVLVIPPRRAFGTGEHATTRHCLELLESTPVRGRAALDVGTGSGILAMAAALLGASFVMAIDNDAEAVEIAHETLLLNGLRSQIDLRLGDLSIVAGRFPVILANIHAGALEASAAVLAALQAAGDVLILSGFSPDEAPSLTSLYARLGYAEEARLESGEWAALRLTRQG